MQKFIVKTAFLNAAVTAAYVGAVASLLFYAPKFFGQEKTVLIPIVMLLLFVFSAAFTSSMIFGRPVLWYIEGKKKDALSLLGLTLGIFFVVTVFAFSVLFLSFHR